MASYREHQQLICLIHELASLLDTQSRFLLNLAREQAIPDSLPDESSLRTGWQDLGFAFSLLTHHAQALQAEFDRLEVVPPASCFIWPDESEQNKPPSPGDPLRGGQALQEIEALPCAARVGD